MKVTLVFPRESKAISAGGKDCPLGILYIATYLQKNNIDCNVIDLTFLSWEDFENKIKNQKPDIIGFSIFTPIASSGFKAIEITKKILPDSIILVGGPHACVDAINTIKNKNVDIVVLGEGEETFFKLIKALENNEDLRNLKGIIFKENNEIIETGSPEPIENLDELPFPDRDFLDIYKYIKLSFELTLITSRGCPFNCFYCQPTQRKIFGKKIRRRTPQNVIEEMEWLINKYKPLKENKCRFYFVDDTFTYDKEWLEEYCRLIKERKIDVEWICSTRVDMVDEKTIKLLKDSGCVAIYFGVESGSQRILTDIMKKGITISQIKKTFKLTHKYAILAHAFLMIGTPTETKDEIEMTNNLVREIHPDSIQISITTPMLGSHLYNMCVKNGTINVKNFIDYDYCKNDYPIILNNLTLDDLKFYKSKISKTWKINLFKNLLKYLKIFISQNKKYFKLIKSN